ncbi:enoyl-CoA hydratase/isomerase family protein [Cryptosporangium aurantiacum]|uniref:Enoyl-CoA hydratase/enoyl-CoA hydratase n=1 Tax=Cryptosporangium aurantiacum TaxID=134849 RepID=A0A1M7R3I8_9ACTN|nr:enoyl-CoA hydratase/isomerase family protein [Cryptosporangium aurantiacum]SHN39658.1 enoyl-CoA hydratase/enoyl-CoA hydratase [Cryptosporangium aurantiacum]
MASVDFQVADHVGHIIINNPEKRNAVTSTMAKQLEAIYDEIDVNRHIRAAVISGAGGESFSAGGYVPDYVETVVGAEGTGRRTVLPKPWRISTPFIAAIEGYCVGGGFALAVACDLRVASDTVRIGASGLKRGLVNGAGCTTRLVRIVGLGNALESLLTSEYMHADKAYRIGLVQRVVPAGQAVAAALELAAVIAQFSPEGVAATKRIAYDSIDLTWDEALEWEERITEEGYRTPDALEGFSAFAEKRPAVFGRNEGGPEALGLSAHWPTGDAPQWRS